MDTCIFRNPASTSRECLRRGGGGRWRAVGCLSGVHGPPGSIFRRGSSRTRGQRGEGFDGFLELAFCLGDFDVWAFWLSSPMVFTAPSARIVPCQIGRATVPVRANFCRVLFSPKSARATFPGLRWPRCERLGSRALALQDVVDAIMKLGQETGDVAFDVGHAGPRHADQMRIEAETAWQCPALADLPGAPRRSS